ncbi:MAG TPA: LysE family translocator [Ktedonobacterales bacterium]|nr:LysE family translocator [Ktedonobacterales bacterium]
MDIHLLLRGVLLGFAIAAPVGPIGVLCIRRTLAFGRITGLVTGLGAATADMCYGAVAAFGLTAVSSLLISQQHWIRLIGGAFLCYLGVTTILARPASGAASPRPGGLAAAYASTLALTLTNPLTILSFAAIFAGLGFASTSASYVSAALLVLGVFLGSALWWLLLSTGVGLLRQRLDLAALRWANRLSGMMILGFGSFALASVLR